MSAIDPSYALLLFPREQLRSPYAVPPARRPRQRSSDAVSDTSILARLPDWRRRRRLEPRSAAV